VSENGWKVAGQGWVVDHQLEAAAGLTTRMHMCTSLQSHMQRVLKCDASHFCSSSATSLYQKVIIHLRSIIPGFIDENMGRVANSPPLPHMVQFISRRKFSRRGFLSGDQNRREMVSLRLPKSSRTTATAKQIPTCFISTTEDPIRALKYTIDLAVQGA